MSKIFIEPHKQNLFATHSPYISLKILKPQSTSMHQLQLNIKIKKKEEEIKDKTNGEGERLLQEWQNLNRLPI